MMVKTTLKEIPLSRRNGFKDDLIQEGALSAYRAIHGFNPEHSSDFKSYLKICVQNSCRDFYRYNKLSLNIPRHIEISSMSQVYADPSEIDKAQYKNRSTTKYELLTELENSEELDALKSAVSRLRPHEQFIIGRFYGLANEPQQSKESLGQGLGLKSSSVGAQIRTIHDRLYYMLSPRFMPEESSE
jgi:RNA polymerase sigma factor (sigma-70 family)